MVSSDDREAMETFHAWRRQLLLPGHQLAGTQAGKRGGTPGGPQARDPELAMSSKMLKVFLQLNPQYARHLVQLQLHFLDQDYTNRVKPDQWRRALSAGERLATGRRDRQ